MNLLNVDLEDLRRKAGHKVLCKLTVVLLQACRQLRRVAKAVEEPAKNFVRPLLRLPPLGALSLVLVFGHSVLWYLELHHLEQKTTPGDKGLGALLVLAQEEDDRG